MKLKEYIEELCKSNLIDAMNLAPKILELEALADYFNVMYGVDFEITIKTIKRPEGRWHGQGLIEKLIPTTKGDNETKE